MYQQSSRHYSNNYRRNFRSRHNNDLFTNICYVFIFFCIVFISQTSSHYNQPQYGTPAQQQQVYHQQAQQHQYQAQYQQQPQGVPQQAVPVQQQGHQVVYQTPQQAVPHYQQMPQQGANLLHDDTRIHDKEHIKEHLHDVLGDQDVNKISEEELQFHYFKMHDNDDNNMLDGSELIKSLIHWHVEEGKQMGENAAPHGTTKVFTDSELEQMIDPILKMDDKNNDGFIDYPEFIAAQKVRGF